MVYQWLLDLGYDTFLAVTQDQFIDEFLDATTSHFSYIDHQNHLIESIESSQGEIAEARQRCEMTIGDINSTLANLYIDDLRARSTGNLFMSNFYSSQSELVHQFSDIQDQDDNRWSLRAADYIFGISELSALYILKLHTCFPQILTAARKISTEQRHLDLMQQMFLLSDQIVNNSCYNNSNEFTLNTLRAIKDNTLLGFKNIEEGIEPQIVKGSIKSITQVHDTQYAVTIQNMSDFPARFKLLFYSEKTYGTFELIPAWGKYYQLSTPSIYPDNVSWTVIDANKELTVVIHIANKSDFLRFNLLGRSATGIYGLDMDFSIHK